VALSGACARAPAPTPARPDADRFALSQLAAEMNDPSAAPLWPMVPADLKTLVAARIPASLSAAERRRLGESWLDAPNVTERCDGRDPQEPFLSFLAGWALLEDLAWSPISDQRVAAAGALYARLRKEPFTGFWQGMKTARKAVFPALHPTPENLRDFDRFICLGPVRDLIASQTLALERHFAAEILQGPPSAVTARVLRDEAARRIGLREFGRALPFASAAARLLPGSSEAWLELAKVSYQVDDVGRGDDALGRALALGADAGSEPVVKATRFKTFAHTPPPKTFEQSLSRFWALFEMDRLSEARALVDLLRRQHPNDARTLLGDVWLNCVTRWARGEPIVDTVHASFLAFEDARNLTNRDGAFDRAYLSLAFLEVVWSAMNADVEKRQTNVKKRPLGPDPAVAAAIDRARSISKQVAASIPGEAAIYALSFDLLEAGKPAGEEHAGAARRALGQFYPRALAVYTAYPSAESYRILLMLSMATDDLSAASAAIMAPLRFDPGDDGEQIALFRARAFVSAAVRAKDWGRLQGVSTLLAAVPRSSPETEHDLDLLWADADLLRAVHGEQSLWRSAWDRYRQTPWPEPAFDRIRASNNVEAICDVLLPNADTSAFWSSLRAVGRPDWPVLVNGAARALRSGHREEAIAILKSRSPGTDEQRPDFVAEWLACLEGAPPKEAAQSPAEGDSPAVEVVDDRSTQGDGSPGLDSNFIAELGRPPGRPTLRFAASDKDPWLIASPRLCWTTRTPP